MIPLLLELVAISVLILNFFDKITGKKTEDDEDL
jgi:hypothetical protein